MDKDWNGSQEIIGVSPRQTPLSCRHPLGSSIKCLQKVIRIPSSWRGNTKGYKGSFTDVNVLRMWWKHLPSRYVMGADRFWDKNERCEYGNGFPCSHHDACNHTKETSLSHSPRNHQCNSTNRHGIKVVQHHNGTTDT